jgi:hypothetical protein
MGENDLTPEQQRLLDKMRAIDAEEARRAPTLPPRSGLGWRHTRLRTVLNVARWVSLPLAAFVVFDFCRWALPVFGRFVYWQLPGQVLIAALFSERLTDWFSRGYDASNVVLSGGLGGYAAVVTARLWVPSRKRLAAGIIGALAGTHVLSWLVINAIRHEWLAFAEMTAAIAGIAIATAQALSAKE